MCSPKVRKSSVPRKSNNAPTYLSLSMSSTAGMRKERVFPDPVLAEPTRSRPSNRCGIVRDWMSVMWVKPMSTMAFSVLEETCEDKDWKDLSERMPVAPREVPGTVKMRIKDNCYFMKYVMFICIYVGYGVLECRKSIAAKKAKHWLKVLLRKKQQSQIAQV